MPRPTANRVLGSPPVVLRARDPRTPSKKALPAHPRTHSDSVGDVHGSPRVSPGRLHAKIHGDNPRMDADRARIAQITARLVRARARAGTGALDLDRVAEPRSGRRAGKEKEGGGPRGEENEPAGDGTKCATTNKKGRSGAAGDRVEAPRTPTTRGHSFGGGTQPPQERFSSDPDWLSCRITDIVCLTRLSHPFSPPRAHATRAVNSHRYPILQNNVVTRCVNCRLRAGGGRVGREAFVNPAHSRRSLPTDQSSTPFACPACEGAAIKKKGRFAPHSLDPNDALPSVPRLRRAKCYFTQLSRHPDVGC